MEINIYEAAKSDIPEIVALAETFYAESDNNGKLTPDPQGWTKVLEEGFVNQYCCPIIAVVEGKIVGYVLIYCQNDFTKELVGAMLQMYVSKPYRATRVARLLSHFADEKFKQWGCKRSFVECGTGVEKAAELFRNLWAKSGFKQVGYVLQKDY